MRCCPIAESLFILELEFLHKRGGCSLIIVFFVLTANWIHDSSYHVYPHLAIYFGSPFGRYPTFGRKKALQYA